MRKTSEKTTKTDVKEMRRGAGEAKGVFHPSSLRGRGAFNRKRDHSTEIVAGKDWRRGK